MRRILTSCAALTIMMALPSVCSATLLDPATLHIGTGAGTVCAVGCGGDPNVVPTSTFDIYQNSGGAAGLLNPVLLIIGIANNAGLSGTTSWFSKYGVTGTDTFINPYPGGTSTAGTWANATAGTYGLTGVNPDSGSGALFGQFTSSSPEVYSFLSLTQPTDASNNFTNWAGADLTDEKITANSFGIYVFALSSSSPLGANGLINITLSKALPTGSYVVAYGQDSLHTHIYDTPFTEAGLTGPNIITQQVVPEPASIALLGTGLLFAGARLRRRRRKA